MAARKADSESPVKSRDVIVVRITAERVASRPRESKQAVTKEYKLRLQGR